LTIVSREVNEKTYTISNQYQLLVRDGDVVSKGQPLTEGHLDLQILLQLCGREEVERYIAVEVQKIYSSQGQAIHNKHIEIMIRQMLSKVMVTDPGKTEYITGQTIDLVDFRKAVKNNEGIQGDQLLLGITRVSLWTKSFLSAASFQETTTVLINAAVQGKRDELRGLKENVIIGKLIPAGTGFKEPLT
jgi:DNA-directed RNA polymerase subunit beta'